MTELVVADIGGTHARFALAAVRPDGEVTLGDPVVLPTAAHASFAAAWTAFRAGRALPSALALAVAAPVADGPTRLTNVDWTIDRATLAASCGVERLTLVNDFEAVALAVAAGARRVPLFGPMRPDAALTSVIGPGTGLGTALIVGRGAQASVVPAEGGHIGLAPRDAFEDALVARLRLRFGRASAERLVAGPGIALIAEAMGIPGDDRALWGRVASGVEDALLGRYLGLLGNVVGDLALAQGSEAVVLAGGVVDRLGASLGDRRLRDAFLDKGRFGGHMGGIAVARLTQEQPGLHGAAIAWAKEHRA